MGQHLNLSSTPNTKQTRARVHAHNKGKKNFEKCPHGLIFKASLAITGRIKGEKLAGNQPEKWNNSSQIDFHARFPIRNTPQSFLEG